jgi:acyl-CoA thioesterase FadM
VDDANTRLAVFAYEMRLAESGQVLATGHTRHVFVNRLMERVRLPQKYHAMFGL